ncbi:hypothetical protein C8Q76DRAFT_769456 [Earliella scabrosa]|nr:hypothetical protein C8Q76DRAFT_769456 [Earliella scabrosa]
MSQAARSTRKRARVCSEDPGAGVAKQEEETAERMLSDHTDGLKHDEEFWYDDGTVILAARDVEFRIYGGLLAHHSPVLKELLAQAHPMHPPPLAGNENSSCPVVRLSDSPEDLRHLLRAYMPSRDTLSFYDAKTPSFSSISASIRLGSKYKIEALYEQSLRFLKNFYTDRLDVWVAHRNWVPAGWHHADVIGVVNIARLIGEPWLLPTALIDCTRLGEAIAHGVTREDGSQEHLSLQDLGICFKAKSDVRKASAGMVLRTLTYAPKCEDQNSCRRALKKAITELPDHMDMLIDGDPFQSYVYCLRGHKVPVCASFNEERRKLWKRLPELLGVEVPGWCEPGLDGAIEVCYVDHGLIVRLITLPRTVTSMLSTMLLEYVV